MLPAVQQMASVPSEAQASSRPDAFHPGLPLALKLIILTVFLPEGTSFFVAGLRLTVTRLIFLVLTPLLCLRFIGKVGSGHYRFVASDMFVPLAGLWMFVGPAVTNDFLYSLLHSGPVVLEYLMAYLSTRVLLARNNDSLSFMNLLCPVIAFVALDGLLDTTSGVFFTRGLVNMATGFHLQQDNLSGDSYRFGFLRAAGPLEHPILFGFTCALGLLLAAATQVRWRAFCIAACIVGTVISFSSAPIQMAIMGFALLTYSRVFAFLPARWFLLSITPTAAAIALFVSTPSPFGHLFDLLTIDPSTAYYRLYIWQSVGPAILENPLFGVLQGDYDYQGSVDSVWLVLSLTYGMPCAILTALSMIGSCSLPTNGSRARLWQAEERLGTALGIAIFLILFMGFTVHFWGSVWILIGLLVGLRAHLGELGRLNLEQAYHDATKVH